MKKLEGKGVSRGGASFDAPGAKPEKHRGKILKGFKETEQITLPAPQDPDNSVTVLRCEGCKALNTDYSVQLFGKCHKCGGHRLTGGSPTFWEEHWLLRRMDMPYFHWKYFTRYGEWGRGRTLGKALREAALRLPQTLYHQVVDPMVFYCAKVWSFFRMIFGGQPCN